MLWALSREIGLADDLGFWGAAFTEHHFHIEGMEVSNNPIMLDLYFGMQTKNIRMGQLANVIPLNNPIRVAEDMAMLDHMRDAGFIHTGHLVQPIVVDRAEAIVPAILSAAEQAPASPSGDAAVIDRM